MNVPKVVAILDTTRARVVTGDMCRGITRLHHQMLLVLLPLLVVPLLVPALSSAALQQQQQPPPRRPARELSFWVHCSLPDQWQRGYWDPDAAPARAASPDEVRRAARLLTETYGANTLYLLYHDEVDWAVAEPLFRVRCTHTSPLPLSCK